MPCATMITTHNKKPHSYVRRQDIIQLLADYAHGVCRVQLRHSLHLNDPYPIPLHITLAVAYFSFIII